MQTMTSCCAGGDPRQPPRWFGNPRLLIVAGALVAVAGVLAWQWNWLVAVGAASLLLSVAPCVAMCALGLCMHRMIGGSRENAAQPAQPDRQLTEEQAR